MSSCSWRINLSFEKKSRQWKLIQYNFYETEGVSLSNSIPAKFSVKLTWNTSWGACGFAWTCIVSLWVCNIHGCWSRETVWDSLVNWLILVLNKFIFSIKNLRYHFWCLSTRAAKLNIIASTLDQCMAVKHTNLPTLFSESEV